MNQVYFSISVLVGIVLIIDGVLLRKASGKYGGSTLLSITTTIEFLWVTVSAIALANLDFYGWVILIPVAYIAHNVLGWLYGVLSLSKQNSSIETSNIYVPIWYVNFGLTFGAVFSLASMVAIIGKNS